MKPLKLSKLKLGRLTAIKPLRRDKDRYIIWLWQCDCGNLTEARMADVYSGNTRSCGCLIRECLLKRNLKHGNAYRGKQTPEYMIWAAMIQRTTNVNNARWNDWGGRGIKTCDRWLTSFENFLKDMGPRPDKSYTLERIYNDGDYEPSNCKWATYSEQNKNKRSS